MEYKTSSSQGAPRAQGAVRPKRGTQPASFDGPQKGFRPIAARAADENARRVPRGTQDYYASRGLARTYAEKKIKKYANRLKMALPFASEARPCYLPTVRNNN
jgi:hypothetical protein